MGEPDSASSAVSSSHKDAMMTAATAASDAVPSTLPPSNNSQCNSDADNMDMNNNNNNNLAPFNPSSETAQRQALDLLNLQDDDVIFDLGCGNGCVLMRAVQNTTGCRCVGIEIDDVFATRAQNSIRQEISQEQQSRIEIRRQDLLETEGAPMPQEDKNSSTRTSNDAQENEADDRVGADCRNLSLLEDATALYLYLLPRGLKKLRPLLEKVVARRKEQHKPFRVVAYTFQVVGWDPTKVDRSTKSGVPIYLYQFDP